MKHTNESVALIASIYWADELLEFCATNNVVGDADMVRFLAENWRDTEWDEMFVEDDMRAVDPWVVALLTVVELRKYQQRMQSAVKRVRELVSQGMTQETAVEVCAKHYAIHHLFDLERECAAVPA